MVNAVVEAGLAVADVKQAVCVVGIVGLMALAWRIFAPGVVGRGDS